MRKKSFIAIFISLIFMLCLITSTVCTKVLRHKWVEDMLKNGYTEKDAYSAQAINSLNKGFILWDDIL